MRKLKFVESNICDAITDAWTEVSSTFKTCADCHEMPAIKYVIANQPFRTKKALEDHVRRVRNATEIGEVINDPVVLALLQLHRDWADKSDGMTSVSAGMVKGAPAAPWTKEIVIMRGAAPFMDISWTGIVKALQPGGIVNYKPDHLDELRKAARHSIDPQIQPLMLSGSHVDHVYPLTFERLLSDWFRGRPELRKVSDVRILANDGAEVVRSWENTDLELDWIEYHRRHARLETVTKEEHYKRSPRSRIDWTPFL